MLPVSLDPVPQALPYTGFLDNETCLGCRTGVPQTLVHSLTCSQGQVLVWGAASESLFCTFMFGFFPPQRAQSALSPSLFLRDSSVFLMPAEYSWLCRRRLVVLVSFLMITHKVERVSDFAPDFEFDLQSPDDIPGLLILKLVQPWPVSRCYLSCRTWKAAYFLVVFYHRLHTLSQEFQEVW